MNRDAILPRRRVAPSRVLSVLAVSALAAACSPARAEEKPDRPAADTTPILFQAEPLPGREDEPLELKKAAKVINGRLNPGWLRKHRVRVVEPDRIEVQVRGSDEETIRRITRLAESPGTLAFRVVADRRIEKDLIERARKAEGAEVRGEDDERLARWVPVRPGCEGNLALDFKRDDLGVRKVKRGVGERLELLLLVDAENVTNEDIVRASASQDARGKPSIDVELTEDGGKRFGRLTRDNLPDEETGMARRLAIVLDGGVFSAPQIRGRITRRAQIVGDFSKQEVEEIAAVLSHNPMPVRLRRVK